MKTFVNGTYTGERALFDTNDAIITNCVFEDGESPLKESNNLRVSNTEYRWKYPLWYCQDVICESCTLFETARSGIWYTKNITMNNCNIIAPKTFRRAEKVVLNNCQLPNAKETFWNCKDIRLENCFANGDYFGMNTDGVYIDRFHLDGNYCFDGGKNIVIKNSILNSKDSFWNSENVTVCDSTIIGEYLGWNSKNVTFINCTIESLQGLCYIKNIKLVNCKLINTSLCFEFCEDIDAEIVSSIDSVKNPISGIIKAKAIKELILEDKYVDKTKIKIITE